MIQLLAAESQLENGIVIWERALQPASNGLYKLKMKCELNKASTLEFVVSPECPYYEQFHLYTTRLTLVDQIDSGNGDVFYFHGRVTKIKSDSFGQKTITAESFMSYLADGVWIAAKPDENEKWYYIKDPTVGWKHVEKAEYDAAENVQKEQRKAQREVQAKKTFEDAVNLYNLGRTSGDYRIEVGDVTQFATAKHDDSSKDGSGDLFSKINDDCIKYHGGYLRERVAHRNGGGYTLYLDYVKNYGHTCGQTLEFGKQIISIDREDTSKEFFTSLVAMGDNYTLFQIPTDMTYNVNVTKADGTRKVIQVQVAKGSPYFDITEALDFARTRIVHLETFSGVGGTKDNPSPYDLLKPALDYISNNYKPELQSYKVKAVDMHLLDDSVDRIMLGYVVPVIPKFSAASVSLTCTAIDFDFSALENTVFTIGVPDQTLTQKYSSTEQSNKKTGRKASATAATVDELSDTFDVHKRRINMIADEEFWAGMQNKEAFISMNDKGEVVFKGKTIYTAADYLLTEITQQDLEIVRNRVANSDGSTTDTIYQRIFGKDGIGFFGTSKTGIGDLVRTNQADIGANSRKFNSYYYANEIDDKFKDSNAQLKALEDKMNLRWSKYESELQQTAKNIHGTVQRTVERGIDDYEVKPLAPTENPQAQEMYELVDGKYVLTTDTSPVMEPDVDNKRSVQVNENSNPSSQGWYELVGTGTSAEYKLTTDTKPYTETHTLYHPTEYEFGYVVHTFASPEDSPKSLKLYVKDGSNYFLTEDTTQQSGKVYYRLESPAELGLYQPKIADGATTYILSSDASPVAGRSYYKEWNPKALNLYELSDGKYVKSEDLTPQPNKVYYTMGKSFKQYYQIPFKQKAYYKANSTATDLGTIASGFDVLHDSAKLFSQATGIMLDQNGNPQFEYVEYSFPNDGSTPNPNALGLYEKVGTGNAAVYQLTADTTAESGKKYYERRYKFDEGSSTTILSQLGTNLNQAYLFSAIKGSNAQFDHFNENGEPVDKTGKVIEFISMGAIVANNHGDVLINAINNYTGDGTVKINADKLNINTPRINISSGAIITAINEGKDSTGAPTNLTINADRLNLSGVLKAEDVTIVDSSGNEVSVAQSLNLGATGAAKMATLQATTGINTNSLRTASLSVGMTSNGSTTYSTYSPVTMDMFGSNISLNWHILGHSSADSAATMTFQHRHEIEARELTGDNKGKIEIEIKGAVRDISDNSGKYKKTFSIASTKFFQDAIAGASVYSIAYDGASNTNPAMSVGTKTIPGTSTQVKVLNNVPLLVTYGTDGVTQSTKTYKVSEVELPSVSFQNGSGGTPAITYSGGKPTIDVKAVMSGTTIKSAETYTGNAITLRPSFTAPSASAANKTFTLVAYDGTTISDDTKITSKDVTLQHEIGQITSNKKKYLRVRTNVKNDSGESSSPVFYTDYRITWNSDSIQNTNGSSSVTAKVSINGVQYDTHKFTGTYATADSDNETVRADGWAAALNALTYAAPSSETLDFGEAKTVWIQKRATEGAASTDIFRRTYTAPAKPTINAPTLNTGTINYTTKSVQGGTQFYVQAPIKVTTSVANLGSTGTVDVPIGATVDDATITYDAKTGKPTVIANVKVAGINDKYIATKTFEGAAPTATLSAGTITEKSGKLPILAKMGNVQIGSGDFSIAMSGNDIGSFAVANEEQTTTIQAKYGNYVLAEKVVKAKYTGNAAATVSDIVNNGNAYLDGSNLKVPAKAIDSSENTLKTANVQVGAISVVGDGGKITEYSQSKKVSFRISGQEIASGTVTAEYPMSVSSTALSSASIALNSRDELFYITANQTITLGDNTSDTTHPLYFPWYTGQYKTYGDDGNSGYGTVIVTAKSGSSATESSQTTVSTNKTYVHPVLTKGSNILFNNNADAYDSYVNAIVREVNGTASSAETVRQLAKETFVISSKAIGVANSTDSTLYALSTAQLGSAVGSGTTYSHRIWSIGHVDALAETIADEPESFNIIAKASASNVTTGKASTKMTLWADSLRIDPGSTTTVKAMIGTTEYASIDIEAKASSAGDLSTVEASFSDPTRTNLDSNGAFYSSTIKAVASSNDTVISESTPAAITATYGVISRTDNRLYGVGLAKFNGVTYAQNGDWIANLSLNREEADQGSNYDFYMTSSVKTNARCSAVSVGTTLCTISIPMWLSASNATLSPGETRNISCSLYGSVSGADTLFASKSIRITCSGGGGSGGSDSNDLQTGWDAAVDKVSIPHGLSSNAAEFKIGYPTDVYDTGTNAYFTLSQSGSMAYVKDRSDNIVAQLSLTGAGGSSSGSPEDGWNEAIRRVVVPNWAGSGSSFSVSYPKDSYTTVTGQGVGTRNYTITQNGSYVYVTTKNASNLDVNVAVKAVDVSAGWTAAKNVTTYPTNANSGSDTISITAPKDAAYMNDTVNYDTIQYKLVQSGNNVYLQNQTTMQNVAGKSITQQGVNAGTVNIGTIDADGQQHTVFASSYGYTHMTQLTYTAPAKPTHAISRKASVSRSTFQQMKIASGYENITWEQVFATGVQAAGYYGIVVQCGNAYKGYYFNK